MSSVRTHEDKDDDDVAARYTYVDYLDVELNSNDLKCLEDGMWLTDGAVSAYFRYLECIVHDDKADSILFMNALVTGLAVRETDEEDFWDIFEDLGVDKRVQIFFPINDADGVTPDSGSHWTLLAFDRRNRDRPFVHYDSAPGRSKNMVHATALAKKIWPLLKVPGNDRCATDSTIVVPVSVPCPQQRNSFDCGMFVCEFANALSRDKSCALISQDCVTSARGAFRRDVQSRAKRVLVEGG